MVVGHQDGGDCIVLGYRPVAGSDNYEVIEVDEAYARKNLTWVVSTNESVNDNGVLPTIEIPSWAEQENEDELETRTSGLNVRHREYFVTSQKECWLCGEGDLRIIWSHYDANCQPVPGWSGGGGENLEKINKNELNAWHLIDNEFFLVVGGQPNPFPGNFSVAWVVYEHDNKPPITATFPTFCGTSVTLNYKSSDPYYGKYGTELSSFFAGNSSFSEVQQEIPYGSESFRIRSRNAP